MSTTVRSEYGSDVKAQNQSFITLQLHHFEAFAVYVSLVCLS